MSVYEREREREITEKQTERKYVSVYEREREREREISAATISNIIDYKTSTQSTESRGSARVKLVCKDIENIKNANDRKFVQFYSTLTPSV